MLAWRCEAAQKYLQEMSSNGIITVCLVASLGPRCESMTMLKLESYTNIPEKV